MCPILDCVERILPAISKFSNRASVTFQGSGRFSILIVGKPKRFFAGLPVKTWSIRHIRRSWNSAKRSGPSLFVNTSGATRYEERSMKGWTSLNFGMVWMILSYLAKEVNLPPIAGKARNWQFFLCIYCKTVWSISIRSWFSRFWLSLYCWKRWCQRTTEHWPP